MTLDNAERREQAQAEFAAGQLAFERGDYRGAIQAFERGSAFARTGTALGGEIQLWLVNAYAALNRQDEAIALCEKLTQHPDYETSKQSKRLLYILQAPRLKLRSEWQVKIPDLSALNDADSRPNLGQYAAPRRSPPKPPAAEPPPEDLSRMNTQDNGFLWVVLAGSLLALGSLAWFS